MLEKLLDLVKRKEVVAYRHKNFECMDTMRDKIFYLHF